MTNKLVVTINNLKVPKIKKLLQYELKFLVPNYSCLQNPWLIGRGLPPPDPLSLSSVLNWNSWTHSPPEKNSWVRHCTVHITGFKCGYLRNYLLFQQRTWRLVKGICFLPQIKDQVTPTQLQSYRANFIHWNLKLCTKYTACNLWTDLMVVILLGTQIDFTSLQDIFISFFVRCFWHS